MLLTLINGSDANTVSAFDRGLLYGQSVFETVAVSNGKPCLLEPHLARLDKGAKVLGIEVDKALISSEVSQLALGMVCGVIRITLTMGEGGRGYHNPVKPSSTRIVSQYDYPDYPAKYRSDGIKLGVVDFRLSHQPVLAGIKHGNRLEQIIIRSQWQDGWQEALVLDVDGNVIEGTQSNVFIVKDGSLITPKLDKAGIDGVMRQSIIELAKASDISVVVRSVSLDEIKQADEVFMSNSVIGIWPVRAFNQSLYSELIITNKLLKLIIKNEFIPTF